MSHLTLVTVVLQQFPTISEIRNILACIAVAYRNSRDIPRSL